MGRIAAIYLEQGRHSEAEALQKQVQEMRKQELGDDHPDTLSSMANLART